MAFLRRPMTFARGDSRWLRAWLALLVFALLGASTLGQIHRSVHGGAERTFLPPVDVVQGGQAHASLHAGGLAALFAGHDDGQCRLYDQLSHGPAALSLPLVLPAFALPQLPCVYFGAQAPWRSDARLTARGPPSSR